MYNFGEFYVRYGKSEKAEPLYLKALDVFTECLGSDNPKTLKCKDAINKLHSSFTRESDLDKFLDKLQFGYSQPIAENQQPTPTISVDDFEHIKVLSKNQVSDVNSLRNSNEISG